MGLAFKMKFKDRLIWIGDIFASKKVRCNLKTRQLLPFRGVEQEGGDWVGWHREDRGELGVTSTAVCFVLSHSSVRSVSLSVCVFCKILKVKNKKIYMGKQVLSTSTKTLVTWRTKPLWGLNAEHEMSSPVVQLCLPALQCLGHEGENSASG